MTATVRRAQRIDAEAIRSIYNTEVLDSTATMDLVARTVDEHRAWMGRHEGAHPVIVATGPMGPNRGTPVPGAHDGQEILGFASLSPWRDRPAYRGTVENSVYVARGIQGSGVGRLLLTSILELGAEHGFHVCMARIAGGNEASVRLHASCGFEVMGVEREVGRKFNRWIDITVMQRRL